MNKTLEFPNLYNLLTVVVPKYIPNEKDEFLLVGVQILQEYITRMTSIKKDRGEFEFAPSVVQSLEFISLIFF